MPPFQGKHDEGWISSDRLQRIPPQPLQPTEVEPYLNYLFGDIARRPRPIHLREGAAVARLLKEFARGAPPGKMRQQLDRLAEVIWRTMLQNARCSTGDKEAAVAFLQKHASTHLVAFDVEAVVKYVREANLPSPSPSPDASQLLARGLAVQTHPTPQLRDDLSERIYAGYHALRRARIHGARRRIAEALNRHNISTEARGETDRTLGSDEVVDRLKQYEDYWKRHHSGQDSRALQQWRNSLVDRWLFLFHSTAKVGCVDTKS
jgi:hypothetical protein